MIRFIACMAFAVASALAGVASAQMPPMASVKQGQKITIPMPGDFDISTKPTQGTALRVPPASGSTAFAIEYIASNTASASDKIGYTLKTAGTPEAFITVNIQPGPPPEPNAKVYEQAGRAILLLFALAVLLESALALLFNWKPFVERLVPRAVRPLIAFAAAWLVVCLLGIDVMASLANAMNATETQASTVGQILTAMVLAGGSAGVNNMLVALGFRSVRTPETTAPKAPPDKAWLAVRAVEGKSRGDLLVYLNPTGTDNALLGVIKGRSKPNSPLSWFVTDRGRVPGYGGHTVDPDKEYTLEVHGRDENGDVLKLTPPIGPLKFAKGAVVDIDVKL